MHHYIKANWPAPKNVHAFTTTRINGHSTTPYNDFNLADHVGDDPKCVLANRAQLRKELNLPQEPVWLTQVHGNQVICADTLTTTNIKADASYATSPNVVCAVLTADCLPILLCDKLGTKIAAIHAGWKSLAQNIIANTIKAMNLPGNQLQAWLGPAIGSTAFEIGQEVYEKFLQHNPKIEAAFKKIPTSKWLANIYILARQYLHNCGVINVYAKEFCTYTEKKFFFSYRRDGKKTGRMATIIWLEK